MSFSKKIVPLLVAGAVALGMAAVPAASATAAAPKTGTLHVQLVTPAGEVIHKSNVQVGWGTSATGDGKLTGKTGAATFKLPVYSKYSVTSIAKDQYIGSRKTGIKVLNGKTTNVKIVFALGATISGTVLNGSPVNPSKHSSKGIAPSGFSDVPVVAYDKAGEVAAAATTSSTGKYTLAGLKSGSYRVQFNQRASSSGISGFTTPYWNGSTTLAGATEIAVTQQTSKKAASAIKSINATVKAYTAVTGTANFENTDSASVYLLDVGTKNSIGGAQVSGGAFSVSLPAGSYKMLVVANDPNDPDSPTQQHGYVYTAADGDVPNLVELSNNSDGDSTDANNALFDAATTITLTEDSDVNVTLNWGGFPPTSTPSELASPAAGSKAFTKDAAHHWFTK